MVRIISRKIINNLAANNNYSKDQLEQMEYILVSILFELIKLSSVIVIFSLFGYFSEIIIILGVMCITKLFIGGYHEDTHIKCFIATMLLTTGILMLNIGCNLTFIGNCILLSISVFCIWHQAPVINSKMPITRHELIRKNRIRGLSITIILGAVSIGLYSFSNYYSLITWTIVFNVILMFNKRST